MADRTTRTNCGTRPASFVPRLSRSLPTRTPTMREPCPDCGCPGERYDGHVCEDYAPPVADPSVVDALNTLRAHRPEYEGQQYLQIAAKRLQQLSLLA